VGDRQPASFGELLRDFRLAAGLSQEALAERASMSPDGISVLERGISRAPHRETVALIANGLQLPPADRSKLEAAVVRSHHPRRRGSSRNETPLHNLPTQLTSFVGRAIEVAEVSALLNRGRLVTVVGPGGVGKTRVALQVARKKVDAEGVEVWLTDLASINRASGYTARTIAQALGIEEVPNQLPLKGLIAYLERKSLLLVIDNCEHVLAGVGNDIRDILQACPGVRILATSREPLKIPGERVCRLQPLSNEEAVKLFMERAEVADYRFMLTDERAALVARLCERLDGIPLAIELAAARIGALPLKTLVDRLDERFSILTGGDRGALPRQRTMRALIDWSYDLLEPREQIVFEQLSVFAGGCTLELAASVCCEDSAGELDVLDVLASLVDKSLVVAELGDEEPRYLLLETMREYARAKLQERGTWDAVARRHALAYYALAERIENSTDTTAMTIRSVRPDGTEVENWQAALEWSLASRGHVELGLRLSGVLRPVWWRYAPNEGRYWVNAAFELVTEATPRDIVARLEYARANVALRLLESHLALDFAQRALNHYRQLDDMRGIVKTQQLLGYVLLMVGRVTDAEPLLHEALTMARELGYRWVEALTLENLAYADSLAGRSDKAQVSYAAAIAAYKAVGDERGAASATGNLAEAKFRAGDAAAALSLSEEAVDALQDEALVPALANLTVYLIALGRFEEARVRALEAVELGRELQQYVALTWALQHLVAIEALGPQHSREESRKRGFRAARLLGFVDMRLAQLGAPRQDNEEREYQRTLEALQATFGLDEMRKHMLIGATLTEEQAITLSERLGAALLA
jgi:predicted ATPase/transcriptional regulator with XRE-family HTH domain